MPSTRYDTLKERVEALRNHLLPLPFEATGTYADEALVRTRTLSFRVLAHAELETYIEDRVVEIAKAAWKRWEGERHVTAPLLHLVGFCGLALQAPPDTLAAPNQNQAKSWSDRIDVNERLKDIVQRYVRMVTLENHGIREPNLMAMLLPIGLRPFAIDPVFVDRLDDFGRSRGEAAHGSSIAVQQSPDPKSEYDDVHVLLAELVKLDGRLNDLLAATNA